MNRSALRAAGAALAATCLACAGAPRRAAAPGVVSTEIPAPAGPVSFATPLEARATMLMLEDERRFDAPSIAAASESPDPAVRAAAAHASGAIADARSLPVLARLAGDGEPDVRAAAALGLEIAGSPAGSPAAEALLDDPEARVRCAAGRAVAALHTDAGERALVAAVRADARPCLLYALARYGDEAAAAAARELGASRDPELRRAAVYAFARNPVPGSSAALVRALSDQDGEAAAFAARALGVLGDSAALPALLSALDRREVPALTAAFGAIGAIEERNRSSLPAERVARIVALSRTADASVATTAIAALRWCADDREAFRALQAQAASGNGRRREVAFLSVAAVLGDRAKSRIADASASRDPDFRAAGAAALRFLSAEAAADLRGALLRDPSPKVREAAVATAPFDPARRPALAAMLADADPGVRSAVVDRLAESGDPAVLGAAAEAMRGSRSDAIPDVALSAVRAAARLRGDAARALLESAASWPRVVVAREARRALIEDFGGDPAALLPPPYATGRVLADYEEILERASGTHRAAVTTSRGTFTVALDAAAAPLTVANFETLARRKFFDGTKFDRVVPAFVVQGGDPTGTLHGGPGYEIRDELVAAGYERGSVGMGLEGADTGGSQWFVTLSRQPHLDGRYPLFGRVIAGQDVVDRIEQGDALERVEVAAVSRAGSLR